VSVTNFSLERQIIEVKGSLKPGQPGEVPLIDRLLLTVPGWGVESKSSVDGNDVGGIFETAL
jgi:hypothetical protein